jgi:hypothetical protein
MRSGGGENRSVDRRVALTRLGLGAAVAYIAPTVLHLDRTGNAAVSPSCNGNSKGNPWCNKGGNGGK